MPAVEGDPRTGGLLYAVWMLAKPGGFEAVPPAEGALRYAARAGPGIEPLCDVYLPRGGAAHPSVVVVHGGGFVIGSRRMRPVRLLASELCRNGWAVCAIDYRLLFRGGGLDAQLADVDAAAAFWRERCAAYGCDPSRISMVGLSAGASLMLLHAGRSGRAYHRLVSVYGASDFGRITGRRAGLILRALLGTSDREVWRARSPAAHATMASPLLLIHGTADRLVPVHHSTRLHERRLAEGLPSELELFEGMRHGWLNDASLPQTAQALERVIAFLTD